MKNNVYKKSLEVLIYIYKSTSTLDFYFYLCMEKYDQMDI